MTSTAGDLPRGPARWLQKAQELSAEKETIHSSGQSSASKVDLRQFILLHAVWPKNQDARLLRTACIQNGWLQQSSLDAAAEFLNGLDSWATYKGYFDTPAAADGTVPYEQGTFATARCCQVWTTEAESLNATAKVEFSPRRASRFQTAAPPKTPTPSGTGLSVFQQRLRGALNIEGTPLTPASARSLGTMSPYSPETSGPRFWTAVRDEQTVNTALVSFLHALSIHYRGMRGAWRPDRYQFIVRDAQLNKVYEARVDGVFFDKDKRPRIIVEVKPFLRRAQGTVLCQIQMQETAQMAAWIAHSPPKASIGEIHM